MVKHKIGWCTMTWNSVWGCRNRKCPYCYARIFAKRFWKRMWMIEANYQWKKHPNWVWTGDQLGGLWKFQPTFLESQFDKKLPKKPQRIFVGSMSEIKYWKSEWVRDMLNKVLEYPQHTFQFLTKFPDVYSQWYFHPNCWLGITVTSTENYNYYDSGRDVSSIHSVYQKFKISNPGNLKFICFEPLLNEISINLEGIDWIILGAETGNRKGKVIPKRKWFEEIVYHRDMKKTPIYVKDNLTKYYLEYKGHKEFPKGANRDE